MAAFAVVPAPLPRARTHGPSAARAPRRARRPPPPPPPKMHFIDAAHTLPEFLSHVLASCGLGMAGILGTAATADARAALDGSERRRARLASGARSRHRRQHLQHLQRDDGGGSDRGDTGGAPAERDWSDVEDPLPLPIPGAWRVPTRIASPRALGSTRSHPLMGAPRGHATDGRRQPYREDDGLLTDDPFLTDFDRRLGPVQPPIPDPTEFVALEEDVQGEKEMNER